MKRAFLPFLIIGFISFSFFSCEKKTVNPDEDGDDEETTEITTDEWIVMDQTYNHFSQLSLWNNETGLAIPETYADLRNFTKDHENAELVLRALMARTPQIGPGGNPVDRFSFIDRAGQVGEEIGQGIHRDIGVNLQFYLLSQNSNDVGLFIRLVQKNSPAETAGLIRGLQIISIDGETSSFTANSNGQVSGSITAANKLFSGNVSSLGVKNSADNSTKNVNIPSNNGWKVDPIVKHEIFRLPNNKKVGYAAYTSFVSVFNTIIDNDGNVIEVRPNDYYGDLVDLFNSFANEGINDLIIDLRYNSGGSTNAAELLTNLIVPSGKDNQIMYEYTVNNLLKSEGLVDPNDPEAPFKPVHINKVGNLNLPKVYFLVTTSSASASELVINNLKPYMNVEIISTNNRGTYGKPVGSFGARILTNNNSRRLATTYITSFKMVNKDGQGDYYTGLIGTKNNSRDFLDYQLGDPEEEMLNDALYYIENGSYPIRTQQARIARGNRTIAAPEAIDFHIDKTVQGLYNLDYKAELKLNK